MLDKPKNSNKMRIKTSVDTINLTISDHSEPREYLPTKQKVGKLAEARLKNISEQLIPASDYIEELKTGEKKKAAQKQVLERTKKVQEGLRILEERNKERRMNST